MKVWLNGALVDNIVLPSTGGGWLMGDGIFESLRTYGGQPFALDLHLQRLENSAKVMKFENPDLDAVIRGVGEVIATNPCEPYGRLRITLLSDKNLLITHVPFEESNSAITLTQNQWSQDSHRGITGLKTISYAENSVALRFARERGFDDALFVNEEGYIVETALANILWLEKDVWFTTSLKSGCLPGVTRSLLIENFGVQEKDITPSQLAQVDAAAITSSVREIVEIERFESKFFEPSQPLKSLRTSFHRWILDKLRS
jgi:branched-chain amino acid aminotransferase